MYVIINNPLENDGRHLVLWLITLQLNSSKTTEIILPYSSHLPHVIVQYLECDWSEGRCATRVKHQISKTLDEKLCNITHE